MPKEPVPPEWEGLPVVDAATMRALDAEATAKRGIPADALMEAAGRAAAAEALKRPCARVVVCCGRGANGGDGLVAARALREAGKAAAVFLCPPKTGGAYPELVRVNLERARAAGVEVKSAGEGDGLEEALAGAELVLDGLLGTGASGKPAGEIRRMIQAIERSKKPVLALDLPSGIHPDTGHHSGVFVTADVTVTFGLAKRGLLAAHARPNVGTLVVADIGYPADLLKAARPVAG